MIISYVSRFCIVSHWRAYFYVCQNHQKPTKTYNFCQSLLFLKKNKKKEEKRKEKKYHKKSHCYGGIGKLVSRDTKTSICYILQLICDSDYQRKKKDRKFHPKKRVHNTNTKCHLIKQECFHAKTRHNLMEDLRVILIQFPREVKIKTRKSCNFHAESGKQSEKD